MFSARRLLHKAIVKPHIRHIGTMSSSAPKPFILFFNPVRHAKAYYESLQDVARTEVVTSKSRDEFFRDVESKYKDVSVIYRTSASGAVCQSPRLVPLMKSDVNPEIQNRSQAILTMNSSTACPRPASTSATTAQATTRSTPPPACGGASR